MKVKIKKLHPNAILPQYSKPGDAGMDLTATDCRWNNEFQYFEYSTGLAIEIPEGFVGLIFPRSSLSNKDLSLSNHVGIVDSKYRGEVKFRFKSTHEMGNYYQVGDRIGQLIILPYPQIEFEEVEKLSETERGTDGWGSSGR